MRYLRGWLLERDHQDPVLSVPQFSHLCNEMMTVSVSASKTLHNWTSYLPFQSFNSEPSFLCPLLYPKWITHYSLDMFTFISSMSSLKTFSLPKITLAHLLLKSNPSSKHQFRFHLQKAFFNDPRPSHFL